MLSPEVAFHIRAFECQTIRPGASGLNVYNEFGTELGTLKRPIPILLLEWARRAGVPEVA